MPAVSKAQQRLMAAAEHGADFPMAQEVRDSMSHDQMHDFAAGPMEGKPEHTIPSLLAGDRPDVVSSNVTSLKARGMNEHDATKYAIKRAKSKTRHKNLGKHLHPRKDGKPHGSD